MSLNSSSLHISLKLHFSKTFLIIPANFELDMFKLRAILESGKMSFITGIYSMSALLPLEKDALMFG